MRAFMALVLREIAERRALLAAAVVASLLPLLAPLLPTTGGNPAADIREAVLWVLVGALSPLFALLLGVSFIGRDLAEGRMGFYFAQPISGPVIWFGKLTAVVTLLWMTLILLILPTALFSADPSHFFLVPDFIRPWYVPRSLAVMTWLLVLAVIVLLAHALGVIWRARSAWMLLDVLAALALGGGVVFALEPFFPMVGLEVAIRGTKWLVGCAVIGLLVAGAVQLTAGRVDLRRGHLALSATLWSILGFAVVAILGWSVWIRSATLDDVDWVVDVSVGSGDWIAVTGRSVGRMDYSPRFLLNTSDRRVVGIGPRSDWNSFDVAFSADGGRAVWLDSRGLDDWELWTVDLEATEPLPRPTGAVVGRGWKDADLSENRARVSVLDGNTVAVFDIDTGDQLAAAAITGEFRPEFVDFHGTDALDIFAVARSSSSPEGLRWQRFRFDLESRTLSSGEDIDSPWSWWDSPTRTEVGVRVARRTVSGEERIALVDPSTGVAVADLGSMPHRCSVRFLGDERIVVVRRDDGEHRLDVFNPDGEPMSAIELPDDEGIIPGGEIAPGRLAVGLRNWNREDGGVSRIRTWLVDLSTGKVVSTLEGYAPVLGAWGTQTSPGAWRVGSAASRLVEGWGGSLQILDPDTGEIRQLVPVPD